MRCIICRITILFGLLAGLCLAQDRGTISGTVTDSQGAQIPGAVLRLSNASRGFNQTFVSEADGNYSFQLLPPGTYDMVVEKEGFRKAGVTGLTVNVNTNTRADVRLEVGQVVESVEVRAETPLLQADRSDLGKVIESRVIESLPLFVSGGMRSNVAFAMLTPGVTSDMTASPDTTGGAPRMPGGTSASNTSLLLDGGESQGERRNDPQMRVVSVEGMEEFKVQTSAFSAEYGRTSNGIMNFTTKSGTNAFHGSLFGQIRNQALNAKGFFYVAPPPSAQTVHNQVLAAASLGGPVLIPKLFDGRNKLFFFFSGERSRAKDIDSANLISVPTAAARLGDLSGHVDANGRMIPIYNPFDGNGGILANANLRVPFPNNQIPASLINPVARTLLSHIPLPQIPNLFLNNNPTVNTGTRTPGQKQGVYTIKMDWNKSDKLRFSGLFSRQYLGDCAVCQGPLPGPIGEAFQEKYNNRYTHFKTDYVFKPTLLSHFSFNYNDRNGAEGPNLRLGPNSGEFGQSIRLPGVPTYEQALGYSTYQTGTFGNYNHFVNTELLGSTVDIKESLTWLKGKQSIKFGFQYLRANYHGKFCSNCAGLVSFNSTATGNPSVSGVTGSDFASFLLGLANAGSFAYPSDVNNIYPYWAWFVQNDIRINSKLTLNVGLRYELPLSKREADGQNSNFDPTALNPAAGNLPGALIFAGEGPGRTGRRSLLQYTKSAWGPRLGFAYQPTSKTVIRAGGAIYYNSNKEDGSANGNIQGFGGTYNAPANFFSSGISVILPNSTNSAQAGFVPFAAAAALAKPPRVDPSLINFGSPNFQANGNVSQIYDYNFTLEQSFSSSTVLRASFHANYGNHLSTSYAYNQLDPKYIPIYGNLLTQPLSTVINNPTLAANGYRLPYPSYPLTATLAQSLSPFPQYTAFNVTANAGHSTYNGLETQLQHNFSNGLWLQVSYTFSKFITDNTSTNVYEMNREKAIAGSDRPHVSAISYIYDLPYGRGKQFGSSSPALVNAVLGGWRIAAVHRYQSGTPIGVSCGQNLFGAGVARCVQNSGVPVYNPDWDPTDGASRYLNPAAFSQPANGVFGNVGALLPALRNPAQLNEDIALSKIFNVGEQRTIEFRTAGFNILNRHLLGGLQTNVTAQAYGRFTNPQANLPRNVQFSLRFKF